MSFREFTMIDVREVLRRWQAGQGARQMAREGVASRGTVARYLEAAEAVGLTPGAELTDEVVRQVAERVQARPTAEPSDPRRELEAHRIRIGQWLEQDPPLKLVRIHELLARDCGVTGSYTTLRRYAHAEFGWRERPSTVRLDDPPPGEESQVDFGHMGYVTDSSHRAHSIASGTTPTTSSSTASRIAPDSSPTSPRTDLRLRLR
jgi:hypothetical protein